MLIKPLSSTRLDSRIEKLTNCRKKILNSPPSSKLMRQEQNFNALIGSTARRLVSFDDLAKFFRFLCK